jgi:hypothetical protein
VELADTLFGVSAIAHKVELADTLFGVSAIAHTVELADEQNLVIRFTLTRVIFTNLPLQITVGW